jgi:hypothetical protein
MPDDKKNKISEKSQNFFNETFATDPRPTTSADPTVIPGLNLADYEPYLGSDIYSTGDIGKLDKMRAERQSGWQQVGRGIAHIPVNVVGGIIENAGYLGALVTEWGDNRDYSNSWTESGKGIRDWWTKDVVGEVYRTNPEAVWDPGNVAWWVQHGEGLVESIAEFLVTGAGVGSLLGKGASAAATALAKSARVAKALGGAGKIAKGFGTAAQVGTAGTLAYTEGAMSGAEVYKKIYAESIKKGLSPDQAKHKAATAAATTVHLNTAVNTLLNVGSVAPLFRSNSYLAATSIRGARNKAAMREATTITKPGSAGIGAAAQRVQNLQLTAPNIWKSIGAETLQEGAEELTNLWAEKSGERVGRMNDTEFAAYEAGNMLAMLNQFEQVGHYFDDTMTSEGALNFVLGAIGGAGQKVGMEFIPLRKVEKRDPVTGEIEIDKETGKPVMERMSGRALQLRNYEISFNKLKNGIVEDLNQIHEKSKELENIVLNKEGKSEQEVTRLANQKRQELFNIEAYRSLQNGTSDYLKGTFEYIAGLDNTTPLAQLPEYQQQLAEMEQQLAEEKAKPEEEQDAKKIENIQNHYDRLKNAMDNESITQAMYEGYAEKADDNTYKQTAQQAIAQIDQYKEVYEDIMNRHNYGDDETQGLAKTMWGLRINSNNYSRRGKNARERNKLLRSQLEAENDGAIVDMVEMDSELAAINSMIDDQANKVEEAERVKKLPSSSAEKQAVLSKLKMIYKDYMYQLGAEGKTKKQVEDALIDKYFDDIESQSEGLYQRKEDLEKAKLEALENHAKTVAKNPDLEGEELFKRMKTLQKEIDDINKKTENEFGRNLYEAEYYEKESKIMNDEYSKLTNAKGRKRFVENGKAFFEKMKAYHEAEVANQKLKEEAEANEKAEQELKKKTEEEEFDPYVYKKTDNQATDTQRYNIKEFFKELKAQIENVSKDGTMSMDEFREIYESFSMRDDIDFDFLDGYFSLMNKAQEAGIRIALTNTKEVQEMLKAEREAKVIPGAPADEGIEGSPAFYDNTEDVIYFNTDVLLADNHRHDYDMIRELLVHEMIHGYIGGGIDPSSELFADLKGLLASMSTSTNKGVYSSLQSIVSKIESDMNKLRNQETLSEDDEKILEMLSTARAALKYAARQESEEVALEEFVTQALSMPQFAAYLNTIPSSQETKVSMSVWQKLRQLIIDLISEFVGNTKLGELTNILDRHITKRLKADGTEVLLELSDAIPLRMMVKPGIYNDTSTDNEIVIESVTDDKVVYYEGKYLSEKPASEIPKRTWTKEEWEEKSKDLVDVSDKAAQEYIEQMEAVDKTADDALDQLERIRNRNTYTSFPLSIKSQIDSVYNAIKEEISDLNVDQEVKDIIDHISKDNYVSNIKITLAEAEQKLSSRPEDVARVKQAALNRIQELLNEAKTFNNANMKGSQKFDDNSSIYTEIEAMFNKRYQEMYQEYKDKLQEVLKLTDDTLTAEELAAKKLNELKLVRDTQLNDLKSLKDSITSFVESRDDLSDPVEHVKKVWASRVNTTINTIENQFINALNQIEDQTKYVQVITDPVNAPHRTDKKIYKVIAFDGNEYQIVNIDNLDAQGNPKKEKHVITYPKDQIYDFKDNPLESKGVQENIFDADYINGMFINNMVFDKGLDRSAVELQLRLFLESLSKNDRINNDRAARALVNMFEGKKARTAAQAFINDVRNKLKDQVEITDVVIANLLDTHLNDIAGSQAAKSKTKLDAQAKFTEFLYTLNQSELENDLKKKIRFRVTKRLSIDKNKEMEKLLVTSNNNVSDKIRAGIIRANDEKLASGKDFIGIHRWEKIDVAIEINMNTEKNPKWVYIGHPRNPEAYVKANKERNELKTYHPGVIYSAYQTAKEVGDYAKADKLLNEFNRLYKKADGQPFTGEDLATIGDNFNKLQVMWDALSEYYEGMDGDNDIIIDGNTMGQILDFKVTGGSLDIETNAENKVTVSQLESAKMFNPNTGENEFFIIDTHGTEDTAFNIFPSVSLHGEDLTDISSEFYDVEIPGQDTFKGGRYWLLTRDITGKIRPIAIKPKRATVDQITAFTDDVKKQIQDFKDGKFTGAKAQEDFNDTLNKILNKHLYLAIPQLPGNKTKVYLSPVFDDKGELLIEDGVPVINVQLKTLNDNGKVNSTFLKGIKYNSAKSFKESLIEAGMDNGILITDNSLKVSIDKDGNYTHYQYAQRFESSVKKDVFKANRLMMNLKGTIRNSSDVLEKLGFEPKEETQDDRTKLEILEDEIEAIDQKLEEIGAFNRNYKDQKEWKIANALGTKRFKVTTESVEAFTGGKVGNNNDIKTNFVNNKKGKTVDQVAEDIKDELFPNEDGVTLDVIKNIMRDVFMQGKKEYKESLGRDEERRALNAERERLREERLKEVGSERQKLADIISSMHFHNPKNPSRDNKALAKYSEEEKTRIIQELEDRGVISAVMKDGNRIYLDDEGILMNPYLTVGNDSRSYLNYKKTELEEAEDTLKEYEKRVRELEDKVKLERSRENKDFDEIILWETRLQMAKDDKNGFIYRIETYGYEFVDGKPVPIGSVKPKTRKESKVKPEIRDRAKQVVETSLKENKIPYETVSLEGTQLKQSFGETTILDYSGRKIVLIDIDGVNIPFYLSTGSGGKANVPAGKWYPFFGIGFDDKGDTWFNKTGGTEMANRYDNDILLAISEQLDEQLGDIRNEKHPKAKTLGRHLTAINEGLESLGVTPVLNKTPNVVQNVNNNIQLVKDFVNNSQTFSQDNLKPRNREQELKVEMFSNKVSNYSKENVIRMTLSLIDKFEHLLDNNTLDNLETEYFNYENNLDNSLIDRLEAVRLIIKTKGSDLLSEFDEIVDKYKPKKGFKGAMSRVKSNEEYTDQEVAEFEERIKGCPQ